MIQLRKATERGYADHGWLKSHHTFSFAGFYDPKFMGFGPLRVMNEDRVAAGKGFGTHAHENMEIVSYVLSGKLEHKDSMGNGEVLRPGEFQRITAGTGITHSEFNPSASDATHFYQIWIEPNVQGLEPSYEQREFSPTNRQNQWQLVASQSGESDSLKIHQDASIYLANLEPGDAIEFPFNDERKGWLQVLAGRAEASGESMAAGDGVSVENEPTIRIKATEPTELMLFDMA